MTLVSLFPTDLPILDVNDLKHVLEEGIVPNQPAYDKGMYNIFLFIIFSFSEPLLSFSILVNVPAFVVEILPEGQNDQLAQQPQQHLPFEDISNEGCFPFYNTLS